MRTAVAQINLSPSAPLNGDVPERFWSGQEASYGHLRVFGCRAFVHIPKDERSKLDGKTKQCIFLGYGDEEFGYRLWDPVGRKLVRSNDVVFYEDQTIEDLDKNEKPTPSHEYPMNLDPIPPPMVHDDYGGDVQNDDDVEETPATEETEQEVQQEQVPLEPPEEEQLRRSTRERQPSRRYPVDEYVMLTDCGEPECYDEALTHEHTGEWMKAMQEEMKSLHENHTYDLVKLPNGKRALKNKWVYRLKTEELTATVQGKVGCEGFWPEKGH